MSHLRDDDMVYQVRDEHAIPQGAAAHGQRGRMATHRHGWQVGQPLGMAQQPGYPLNRGQGEGRGQADGYHHATLAIF